MPAGKVDASSKGVGLQLTLAYNALHPNHRIKWHGGMASKDLEKAQEYRRRAAERRSDAAQITCPNTRAEVIKVAETFESMADSIETASESSNEISDHLKYIAAKCIFIANDCWDENAAQRLRELTKQLMDRARQLEDPESKRPKHQPTSSADTPEPKQTESITQHQDKSARSPESFP